jgi:hypothetical protein
MAPGTQTFIEEALDRMTDLAFAVLIGSFLNAGSAVGVVSALN